MGFCPPRPHGISRIAKAPHGTGEWKDEIEVVWWNDENPPVYESGTRFDPEESSGPIDRG